MTVEIESFNNEKKRNQKGGKKQLDIKSMMKLQMIIVNRCLKLQIITVIWVTNSARFTDI